MEINLDWKGDREFVGQDESGNQIMLDGHRKKGVSPMSTLLFGLGSCAGIDIVMILQKMKQEIRSFRMEVKGDRIEVEKSKPWKKMHVIFHLEGDIDPKKAERAMQLSLEKYCSEASPWPM